MRNRRPALLLSLALACCALAAPNDDNLRGRAPGGPNACPLGNMHSSGPDDTKFLIRLNQVSRREARAICDEFTDEDEDEQVRIAGPRRPRGHCGRQKRGDRSQMTAEQESVAANLGVLALTLDRLEDVEAVQEVLSRHGGCQYMERDQEVHAVEASTPRSWGIDRIDQADLPLDSQYTLPGADGSGTHVYIIDTGVQSHSEYAGRLGDGYDFVDDDNDATDCHGHGTHCAGTAVGTTTGVATKATVHGVRVLGCSGSGYTSDVIAGMNWVRQNHVKPAVASMSLGGGYSQASNDAVQDLVDSGVAVAVAAGNDNFSDACNLSPASAPAALTVGASTSSDGIASFSNVGSCVDLFAPGQSITSSVMQCDTCYSTWSGTSMATPHVAGALALAAQLHPDYNAVQLSDLIIEAASDGKISGLPGTATPNKLLYTHFCGGESQDCVVSDWSDWSQCSSTCGAGSQTRTRTVLTEPTGCGMTCPALEESRDCDPANPPCLVAEPTEDFSRVRADLKNTAVTFSPTAGGYDVCQTSTGGLARDITTGDSTEYINICEDCSVEVKPAGFSFTFFNEEHTGFFVSDNGFITFGSANNDRDASPARHFAAKRVSLLFRDLTAGPDTVSVTTFADGAVAVTYENVYPYGAKKRTRRRLTAQILMIPGSNSIVLSYSNIRFKHGIVGVSSGNGEPSSWAVDLSTSAVCPASPSMVV